MSQEYLLEMSGIEKAFPGVKALSDASLRVKSGEIHGLIGENGAGKSTLMKILLGDYTRDAGEIIYKGEKICFSSPRQAKEKGICMIPQEINMVSTADLAENVWLGREHQFATLGLINKAKRLEATRKLFKQLKIELDPKSLAVELSVAQLQLLALARAVSYEADIIIMDEPTSSLSESEVKGLFKIMEDLINQGKSIIFISHKLDEMFTICSHITILRDGYYISNHKTTEITKDELITKIAGREIKNLYPVRNHTLGKTVLEVKDLSQTGTFQNISFSVKEGEILSLYGLVGAGRSEIMCGVFGIDEIDGGEIRIEGKPIKIKSPKAAIRSGLAMVTEDRLSTGIIGNQSVLENVSLVNLYKICNKFKFVKNKQEREDVNRIVEELDVKIASLHQVMSSLSGGNQQKAILGKWLLTKPKILILDEPTRGIDVGSKAEIHKMIANLAEEGMAVIMISSELSEALGMSDRIVVIREGKITGEFAREELDSEIIINHAFGYID